MNRDLLGNADRTLVARAAMEVIDALQKHQPATQALGLAVTFRAMMDHYKLNLSDLFTFAGNIVVDADGRRPEFKTVEDYMQGEWK